MTFVPDDGFPYYHSLVENKKCNTLFTSLFTFTFLKSIREEKANYRYGSDKWSIKQIIGHITDH